MKLLKKFLSNLQTHIIIVFSVLLFFSFATVGIAFNIAVNSYITASASEALEEARANHLAETDIGQRGWFIRAIRGNRGFLTGNVRHFVIDGDYTPLAAVVLPDMERVAGKLEANQVPLVYTQNKRFRVGDVTYFLSILPWEGNEGLHTVFFLDVSDITRFNAVVNRLLLSLVAVIWLSSIIIAGILADSMARPFRKLRDFVRQIGHGNFTPNSFAFTNEEFEELNRSLNHTARQLAYYDNDQKTFFQNVSHELRTPLMSIKSYAEGIKYGIMDPASSSETILEATDRLTEMVDDILYVSRIDSLTAPERELANICAIIEDRIDRQKNVAEKWGIQIDFASDGESINIPCVVAYIERAVDNLISNALRYAVSAINIECYEIGSRVILRVTDDGPGFEPDTIPRVFERFYHGKNGQSGIGLAMVKSITDQHKGIVTAENGPEGGAVLTISLPCQS